MAWQKKKRSESELNEILPKWIDMAVNETHPFVIHAKNICGKGNQILRIADDVQISGAFGLSCN